MTTDPVPQAVAVGERCEDDEHQVSLIEILTWLGERKRLIVGTTAAAAALSLAFSLTLTPIYTAHTSLLPPGSLLPGDAATGLASSGSLGGLAGVVDVKSSDELYFALLKSDGVARALNERFDLMARYNILTYRALRIMLPLFVRMSVDKKSGIIDVQVDDKEPNFAAELANAQVGEVNKVLSRLAASEAQQRRAFFEQQVKIARENLVRAEMDMQRTQERSGVVLLDQQTEALIAGAARVRARIAEREVRLDVIHTGSTDQDPGVIRLKTELQALRSQLAGMESTQGGTPRSAVDMPVRKIPAAAVDYVRARRELALQEALLETMARQLELARLDQARGGSLFQQIDKAEPPDWKSKPSRAAFVLISTLLALVVSSAWVMARAAMARERNSARGAAWWAIRKAWRFRA